MKITFIANIKGIYLGYTASSSDVVTIGREIGNTIAPINVDGFSRHHARIFAKGDDWYVEDLGSTNGTYRNREKLEAPAKIEKGDSIRCGLMEIASFSFEPETAPAAVAAAEPPKPASAARVATPVAPAAEVKPVEELKPVEEAKPAAPTAPSGTALRRPTIPGLNTGLKPGLKLPQKPGALPTGLKLPPKPGAAPTALKLPTKPEIRPGLKLPGKPAQS